jgi:hypothetical protein
MLGAGGAKPPVARSVARSGSMSKVAAELG